MRVYALYEVSSQPRKNDHRYSSYKVYNNELYVAAEVNVEGRLGEDIPEDVSDEEFDRLVEEELENILETLRTCGRYPEHGIPEFVAY